MKCVNRAQDCPVHEDWARSVLSGAFLVIVTYRFGHSSRYNGEVDGASESFLMQPVKVQNNPFEMDANFCFLYREG
jgi:hypothetical protein